MSRCTVLTCRAEAVEFYRDDKTCYAGCDGHTLSAENIKSFKNTNLKVITEEMYEIISIINS